jgi:carbon storage regulator
MLVLSRKINDQILIGDNIRITVISIQGRHVRLGIEAPISVPVFRDEVLRARAKPGEGAHGQTAPQHECAPATGR